MILTKPEPAAKEEPKVILPHCPHCRREQPKFTVKELGMMPMSGGGQCQIVMFFCAECGEIWNTQLIPIEIVKEQPLILPVHPH